MTREESMLAKRFVDLSKQAYNKGIVTFSDFLNLNEQNIFHTCISELYSDFEMFGGYDYAERQMIAFLPDALVFPWEYPFGCYKIEPVNRKFADELSHRDVLGTLMGMGIERNKIGDILVKEHEIYVICHKNISDYIMKELTRIRHTTVKIKLVTGEHLDIQPNLKLCEGIVSSNRLDGLLANFCGISRGQAAELIKKGCVYINGKDIFSTSYSCNKEEIISVRGYGRFRFIGIIGETKKGRIKIQYYKYV